MGEMKFPKPVTYYPSTHPGFMTVSFLAISGLLAYLLRTYADHSVADWQITFVCGLFWIGAGFYGIKWMHSAVFTEEGIVFSRFGKEYRRLSWQDVAQVGVAKEYKASRLTLVITPVGSPVYENFYETTTSYVEKYRRQLILLDGTKENLATVTAFCGELSYHAGYPYSGQRNH